MIVLAIVSYMTNEQKICEKSQTNFIIYAMINPFTQSFFNQVLDYFICKEASLKVQAFQWQFCAWQIFVGIILFFVLIACEERSFKKTLEAHLDEMPNDFDF